jgi:TIR domain
VSRQVFISYAHADNLPMDEKAPGWVSDFVDKLQRAMARQSGGGAIEFWMDHRLEPQRRVDEELCRRIRESAVILAVMSPRYLESVWCQREMATFVQEVGGGVSADRVFMVELLPTERSRWHPEVQDLTAVKFWHAGLTQPEPQTLGWPLPDVKGDRDYWGEVNTLATRLARQLQTLPVDLPPAPPATATPAAVAAPAPVTSPPDGPLTLLISTESADEPLATEAQTLLAELDADAYLHTPPAENEPPADYRANFERQLHDSHGVIVVYGQAPRTWVQAKFGEIRKVLALARKGTWAGLLEGPPEPKATHGLPPRNLMVLDCKQGVNKEQLHRFLQALRGEAGRV